MAQQVYGCKRGRLLSVAGDLAGLPLLGAAATDCPSTLTAPTDTTPAGRSWEFRRRLFWWCRHSACFLLACVLFGILPEQGCVAAFTAQERSPNVQLLSGGVPGRGGLRGQSAPVALSRSRRAKSPATSSKRARLQPHTCCAIAHQVSGLPAGDLNEGAATDAPPQAAAARHPSTRAPEHRSRHSIAQQRPSTAARAETCTPQERYCCRKLKLNP